MIPAEHVDEFKIASRLVVLRAQHTHGGEKRLATPIDAVKARHDEHRLSSDILETGGRSGDPDLAGERQSDHFPRDHVDFVVRHTRMTLTGFGRFDLAYFRHTERWFTVYRGLTAAECFREIEENEVFWPTT